MIEKVGIFQHIDNLQLNISKMEGGDGNYRVSCPPLFDDYIVHAPDGDGAKKEALRFIREAIQVLVFKIHAFMKKHDNEGRRQP